MPVSSNPFDRLTGRKNKHDIFNSFGLLLIPKHTVLKKEHIEILRKHDISIADHELEPGEETPQTPEKLIDRATEEIRDIFQTIRTIQKIPMAEVRSRIIPCISQAAENPSLFSILSGLQAKDDYTYRHNIGVGVMAALLGKWLHLSSEELSLLTVSAALHDVGKINIPDSILNKPGKFTDAEYELMKRHTVMGYEIIQNTPGLNPRVALVALQHHEREDGGGYPYGITGEQMDVFSKIVAVSDVFHALASNRIYRRAVPFYRVMEQMLNEGFGKLNTEICAVFVQRMMDMSVGSEVVLTNGMRGQIVLIHPHDPVNPLVRSGDRYIDLSKEREIHLEQIVG